MPLLFPVFISETFPDTKVITDFYLSHCIKVIMTGARPRFFLDGKTISFGNGYTSLLLKHSFFLRVQGWKVSMFSYLCFKYWEAGGILLTYWNDYQKLYTKINENNTKIHVHFPVKRPFSLSYVSTSRDMYLLVIVQKNKQKKSIIFGIKFTVYIHIKSIKKQ